MSADTMEDLRRARRGDRMASQRLLEDNTGLIWSVVRRFFGRGVEAEDLYQIGCVGFLKAVDGFDEGYGTRFSTYAVPKISGEIRRFLRDDGAIKVSRSIKEQAVTVRSARNALEQKLDIAMVETATCPTESLQRETGEDGFTLEQVLGDYQAEERVLEHVSLREALRKLPEKELQVISLRFYHGMTQDAASRVIGVSQVQVSRLEKRAIEKLRVLLE